MSTQEAEATTPDTDAEATVPAVDLSSLSDARIDNQDGFKLSLSTLIDVAKRAVIEEKRANNAKKALAEARVAIRAFIVRPNGFPDWAADTDAYAVAVQTAETPILASLGPEGKRRLDQSVRQHVKRNFLLPGMVSYILANAGGNAKLADDAARWAKDEKDEVLTSPSAALVREVRKHYAASKLTLPDGPFAETHAATGGGAGPESSDPPSALTALSEALGGLAQIVPRYAVMGILRATSDLAVKITEGKLSEVQDRPNVVKNLHRTGVIVTTLAKLLDGKATDEDIKTMEAAYFSEVADKIEA